MSSTFGRRVAAAIAHYAASKVALEYLTRCWALELAPLEVRMNAVTPGPTETAILERTGVEESLPRQIKQAEARRVPLERPGTPEEVAAWVVTLAGQAREWIIGQAIRCRWWT